MLLIAVVASGCAGPVRRSATAPKPPGVQAEPRTSSRSDRLRDDPAPRALIAETPTPARAPEPVRAPTRAQPPESPRPSEAAPAPGTDEPSPLAVIDWLLQQRR